MFRSRSSVSLASRDPESETSEGDGASQPVAPAPGSVTSETDTPRNPMLPGRIVLRLRGMPTGYGSQFFKKARHLTPEEGSSAAPVNPKPPHPRFPGFPESGTSEDVIKWGNDWRKIGQLDAKAPRDNILTLRAPTDPETTDAVQIPRNKKMILGVAQSIVTVSSIGHDGEKIGQYSGIVIKQLGEKQNLRTIIVTCSKVVCMMGKLLNPVPKISVGLPDSDKTILEGTLLFFNDHYDLALLEIKCPLHHMPLPSVGSAPTYGQRVFVLGRDEDSLLMARRGEILWEEEANFAGRNYYMFLNCEVPEGAAGGPVVDYDGNIIAMAFRCTPNPAILSLTTIITCIDMWLNFGRIVRPLHGLGLKTLRMLDLETLEACSRLHNGVQRGYIVTTVAYNSAAENLGIEAGSVILSMDGDILDLPKLEDYLLSIGWAFLNDSCSATQLMLFVTDYYKGWKLIELPLVFCDESEEVSAAEMISEGAAPNPVAAN